MVYIIGMSHVVNILKSFSAEHFSTGFDEAWNKNLRDTFYGLKSSSVKSSLKSIQAAIVGGFIAGEFTTDGKPEIKVHTQFLNLLNSISKNAEPNMLFSVIDGNEHSLLSMIQHPVPYDFILPTHPEMEITKGSQIIPYAVVEGQILDKIKQALLALRLIKSFHPYLQVFHVLPPSPIASEKQIMNQPEVFAQHIARYGVSPASLRLKYYLAYQSIITREAEKIGVRILTAPEKSMDKYGFLLEDYWFAATHANVKYGKLVVDQINKLYAKCEGK